MPRLADFTSRFSHHFEPFGEAAPLRFRQYIEGLAAAKKKNMDRMEEAVPGADEQQLQHFLTNVDWDHRVVMHQVASEVDAVLGGPDTGLILDETAFPKKGKESVGVARQWCGTLGKVENCQVAVFGVLVHGERVGAVDTRLFLPQGWTDDPERCRKAGVPREDQTRKTKADLALEIVTEARERGLRFGWVGFDAFYSKNPEFLATLDQLGETFVADVDKDQRVYLEDPEPTPGKSSVTYCTTHKPVRVDQWARCQHKSAWKRITVRESTKGPIEVDVLNRTVWIWNKKKAEAKRLRLIVRRDVQAPEEIKYSLSNADGETLVTDLVYQQAQRYWVERWFQDAKMEVGLSDYQVRGWRPWHHHMSLVMMAMLFLLHERMAHATTLPLLSCADITILLAELISQPRDLDDLLRQLRKRHRRRRDAIDSARRQKLRGQRPAA